MKKKNKTSLKKEKQRKVWCLETIDFMNIKKMKNYKYNLNNYKKKMKF